MVLAVVVIGAVGVSRASSPAQTSSLELTAPIARVTFATDSSAVGDEAREQLASAASWLADHPNRLLVIQGYASRPGVAAQNLRLSQDRADAVRGTLLALGADPLRIVEAAYGEQDVDASRRVDVRGTLAEFPDIVRGQNNGVPARPVQPVQPPRRRTGPNS
jgi:outer membrane protein OmpA-like peptidoglycan-associated protein